MPSSGVIEGLFLALSFKNLLAAFFGTVLGIIMGVLPGVGSSMTVALLIPITYGMSPDTALILLGSIYGACVWGGSISAILINTPGETANIATVFDGYPMAQQGRAREALGISLMASFLGSTVSVILLALVAPPLAHFALRFGPPEYFTLTLVALTFIAVAVSKETILKGLIATGLGFILAFIGFDPVAGVLRYTFGITYLTDGIKLVPAIIGLFAISESFFLAEKGGTITRVEKVVGGLWEGFKTTFRYPVTLLRSIGIGAIIGALPGIGVATANPVAYLYAKKKSKHPESFGSGNPEGVVAAEASNNAVTGTAFVLTLTLGIPGSVTAAVFLGGLMIHGLIPGPDLFTTYAPITFAFIFGLMIGTIFFFILGILFCNLFAKVTNVPNEILAPLILVLCFIGIYSLNSSMGDLIVATILGMVGYILRKNNYPLICVVIPLVLGPIAEKSFHQTMMISEGSWSIFFTRPISLFLILLLAFVLFSSGTKRLLKKN